MTKRALLVGCNYPGTESSLNGCINDVMRMKELLLSRYGFDESNIVMMIDTDDNYPQPTGANIRKGFKKIVQNTESGDILFFHYSGHGTRVPPESGEEDDTGYDECIVPTDMNLLSDDDFRDIVKTLPDGVMLTMVTDSCHSGGLIDHEKEQIGDSEKQVGGADQSQGQTRDFHLPGQRERGFGGNEEYGGRQEGGGYGREGGGYGQEGGGYGQDGGQEGGYGGREEFRRPPPEFGREEEFGRGPPEFGRRPEEFGGGGEYGRRPEFGGEEDFNRRQEYGGGRQDYGRPGPPARRQPYRPPRYGPLPTHVQAKNRAIPTSMIMSILGSRFGVGGGSSGGGIRTALYSAFGADSSPMAQMFVGVLMSQAPTILKAIGGDQGALLGSLMGMGGGGGEKSSGFGGMLSSFTGQKQEPKEESGGLGGMLSAFTGGNKQQEGGAPQESSGGGGDIMSALSGGGGGGLATMALGFLKSQAGSAGGGEGGPDLSSILSSQTSTVQNVAQQGNKAHAYAGWKPSAEEKVGDDLGILISGCQSEETSADADPTGDATKAYGAMTNSLNEVLASHDGPISYKELVMKVRAKLKTEGFAQSPGLYCSDANSDQYFICGE